MDNKDRDRDAHTEAEEQILLRRLAGGDRDAFTILYRRYQPMIYKFAHLFSRDSFVAEEITQNVLFKLWSRKESFAGVVSLEKFLITIARNELINRARNPKIITISPEHLSDHSVEQIIDYRDYQNLFSKAVQQLPEKQRKIFLLRTTNGLTIDQIAAMTHANREAIKRNYSRAANTIREYLRKHGGWTGSLLTWFLLQS